jgi:hypothetical protein
MVVTTKIPSAVQQSRGACQQHVQAEQLTHFLQRINSSIVHQAQHTRHANLFFFLPRLYIYTDKLGDWFCHGKQMDKPQRKHVLRQSNQIYSDIRIKQATRISEGRDMGITDNMHGSSYTWIAVYKQQVGTRRHVQFLFSHTRAIPHSQIKHAWNQFCLDGKWSSWLHQKEARFLRSSSIFGIAWRKD